MLHASVLRKWYRSYSLSNTLKLLSCHRSGSTNRTDLGLGGSRPGLLFVARVCVHTYTCYKLACTDRQT